MFIPCGRLLLLLLVLLQMSWITVLPSHSCMGTLQSLDIKLLYSSVQTSADHRRLSWLPVSFLLHVKYTLSYHIVLGTEAVKSEWIDYGHKFTIYNNLVFFLKLMLYISVISQQPCEIFIPKFLGL